jgi:hypothetical protein
MLVGFLDLSPGVVAAFALFWFIVERYVVISG